MKESLWEIGLDVKVGMESVGLELGIQVSGDLSLGLLLVKRLVGVILGGDLLGYSVGFDVLGHLVGLENVGDFDGNNVGSEFVGNFVGLEVIGALNIKYISVKWKFKN